MCSMFALEKQSYYTKRYRIEKKRVGADSKKRLESQCVEFAAGDDAD